ncbi:phytanoyl-CoA dioxygenase family protein [Oceanibium sediminis]|uniref:phytanoyl-CoA dioxygenase family protein n=1 Tax=Oceanibium sediminis TaxID=2026339 RepID=UPI000DD350F8|nr:phytanoyl-CoA dioxygenase family protein [Oceanibium sediminis]
MEVLSETQVRDYRETGYLVLEGRVPEATIQALRDEIARFEEEARGMTASNARLDLEDSHRPDAPRVRRIKRPDLISPVVRELLRSDVILAPARDLLGADIRLHTTKLNMKKAGYGAAIAWHQDFAFYPHTNDDVLAIGVIIDDIGPDNGPLMVFPGSHRGPVHDHHVDGVFAGAMDLGAAGLDPKDAAMLTGPAGSLTIHHARIVHGSALNRSDRDRRLLFLEMMAADAFPIMGSMTPFDGIESYNERMLCGRPTLTPRLAEVPVRIPQPQPAQAGSIYEIQSHAAGRGSETPS